MSKTERVFCDPKSYAPVFHVDANEDGVINEGELEVIEWKGGEWVSNTDKSKIQKALNHIGILNLPDKVKVRNLKYYAESITNAMRDATYDGDYGDVTGQKVENDIKLALEEAKSANMTVDQSYIDAIKGKFLARRYKYYEKEKERCDDALSDKEATLRSIENEPHQGFKSIRKVQFQDYENKKANHFYKNLKTSMYAAAKGDDSSLDKVLPLLEPFFSSSYVINYLRDLGYKKATEVHLQNASKLNRKGETELAKKEIILAKKSAEKARIDLPYCIDIDI